MRSRLGMSDQPPPKDASTKARQGETTGVVRWVLGIFLTLVVLGMVVAFLKARRIWLMLVLQCAAAPSPPAAFVPLAP
jgi:hypothetical protein